MPRSPLDRLPVPSASRRLRGAALAATAVVGAALAVPSTLVTAGPAGAAPCAWLDTSRTPAARTTLLLSAMRLDDKLAMVDGTTYFGTAPVNVGGAGLIPGNEALCIPDLVLQDAGAGIGDTQVNTTAYPTGIAQTATWDPAAQQAFGVALGQESFTKGGNVLLAPGVEIARTPLNGRNFEYAGEDPYLAGQTAAAVIRGVQSQHVVATVKHYVGNVQETDRNTVSSDVTERTLQEIYLPAFETAVKQGGAGSVMCSYNKVNSVYACENAALLNAVLKKQFGFGGWVMSDWYATHSSAKAAKAGLDMQMPNGPEFSTELRAALADGRVPMSRLDDMVRRILGSMFRIGLFDHVPNQGAVAAQADARTPQHLAVARNVAAQGAVLLKNQGALLPLTGRGKRIALIGGAVDDAGATLAMQGGGSGHVPLAGNSPHVVSPIEGVTPRALASGDVVVSDKGTNPATAAAVAAAADVAVVIVSDAVGEGVDRPDLTSRSGTCMLLPTAKCVYDGVDQDALVAAVAAANPNTVVVLENGGPVAMPWLSSVRSVLEMWYPGEEVGNALAALLYGDVNPSGKLPVTFPKKLSDGPVKTAQQYPGVDLHSRFTEGLQVGYRWYDAKGVQPLFPFGHGLSYTSFGYSGLKVERGTSTCRDVCVSFTVRNTGTRAGAEVAQVYVRQPAAAAAPPKQLKGFRKVSLAPGQSRRVQLSLTPRAFAHWDTARNAWRVTAGTYGVQVGGSSRSLPLSGTVPLAAGPATR